MYAVRKQREGEMLLYGLTGNVVVYPDGCADCRALTRAQILPWASVPT